MPDDSFHDLIDGEFKGVKRVRDAWDKLGVTLGDRIVTSRDPEMEQLAKELRRETLPEGFEQWQLPIVLGQGGRPVMAFITSGQPHALIPDHKHANDAVFRVVLGGSIIFRDSELIPGDWMYVPAGQSYSFRAGRFGCVVMHLYNGALSLTREAKH